MYAGKYPLILASLLKKIFKEKIMGITKVGKIYYTNYRDADSFRSHISLHTKNKIVAQRRFKDLLHQKAVIRERIVINITWDDFKIKLYHYMKKKDNDYTFARFKRAIRYLEDAYKPHFLRDVTPNLLQRAKEHMIIYKDLKNRSINDVVSYLKATMHIAENWQLIHKQDWTVVKKLRTPRGRRVFHTPEEVDKILNACPNDMWRLIVLLGADAGLRRGEISELRWQDVDFQNNQLYIAPNKTIYHRFVPMTEALRNTLEIVKKDAINEFVINAGQYGTHVRKDCLTKSYRLITKAAGVPSFLHKLRHTFASHLVQNGVDLYVVSKLLGHSSIKMTEIYAHLLPDNFQRAVMNLPTHEEPTLALEDNMQKQPSTQTNN